MLGEKNQKATIRKNIQIMIKSKSVIFQRKHRIYFLPNPLLNDHILHEHGLAIKKMSLKIRHPKPLMFRSLSSIYPIGIATVYMRAIFLTLEVNSRMFLNNSE